VFPEQIFNFSPCIFPFKSGSIVGHATFFFIADPCIYSNLYKKVGDSSTKKESALVLDQNAQGRFHTTRFSSHADAKA
jgi:hypothetical protein